MKSLNYLLLFILLSLTACKKDPTKNATLPPATQEGKNTIGFTLNGEVWVPYAKCSSFGDPCREVLARYGASGGAAPNGIDFGFERISNGKMSTLIISSTGIGTITTTGNKIDSVGIYYKSENSNGNNGNYTGTAQGSKLLITKIDIQNQIIAGEFEFVLTENNGSGNVIILKGGRFDFMFNACKCSN